MDSEEEKNQSDDFKMLQITIKPFCFWLDGQRTCIFLKRIQMKR